MKWSGNSDAEQPNKDRTEGTEESVVGLKVEEEKYKKIKLEIHSKF